VKIRERKTHWINLKVDELLRWRRIQIRDRRIAVAERSREKILKYQLIIAVNGKGLCGLT
jgi:hypothetical protein